MINKSKYVHRKGVVAVFVAFSLIALLGFVALTLDGGLLYLEHRKARTTADAAAMAAACELFRSYPSEGGLDPRGVAHNAAMNTAQTNGYGDNSATSVTVHIPPQSGTYAGRPGYVEVLVEYRMPRGFSRIWGSETIPIRARAVARGAWAAVTAGVLILDYEDRASLNSQGNGAFTETGGPVIINSNNPSAVVVTGNGAVKAPEFFITGGVHLRGNGTFATEPVPGQIFTGVHPTPDPLAYLPPPPVPPDGTMTITNLGKGNRRYELTPGRYRNLPNFNTGDEVILKQASANEVGGIYYIDGGGFKTTGASITMDPHTTGGVMIYNKPASQAQSHKVQITGNAAGKVDLGPLTDGPYAGIVLWQDRDSSVDVLLEGNGQFTMRGTIYTPGAKLNINGNGDMSTGFYLDEKGQAIYGASGIGSQFIVNNLSLGGNGNINIIYNGPDVARTRIISLVE
jgi:hypothetical protein